MKTGKPYLLKHMVLGLRPNIQLERKDRLPWRQWVHEWLPVRWVSPFHPRWKHSRWILWQLFCQWIMTASPQSPSAPSPESPKGEEHSHYLCEHTWLGAPETDCWGSLPAEPQTSHWVWTVRWSCLETSCQSGKWRHPRTCTSRTTDDIIDYINLLIWRPANDWDRLPGDTKPAPGRPESWPQGQPRAATGLLRPD